MRTNNENYEPFFVLLQDYNYFVVCKKNLYRFLFTLVILVMWFISRHNKLPYHFCIW